MKVISALTQRKKELLAEIETAMAELRVIEITLDSLRNLPSHANQISRVSSQIDLFEKGKRKKTQKMTIKEMVVTILSEAESALEAETILDEINKRWNKGLIRTSLSPQLSRLKQSGMLSYAGKKWMLTEKYETPDAATSGVRKVGLRLRNTQSTETNPWDGPNSEESPNRKGQQ